MPRSRMLLRNNQKNKLPRPPKSGLGFFIVFLSFFPAFLRRGEKNIEKTHPFCKKGGDKRTKCGKIKARTRSDARRAKNLPTACGVHYDYFIPRRRNGHSAKKAGERRRGKALAGFAKITRKSTNAKRSRHAQNNSVRSRHRSVSAFPADFPLSRGSAPPEKIAFRAVFLLRKKNRTFFEKST